MNPSQHPNLLAPSILAADHSDLATGLEWVKKANCQWVHLDIMDGHFVPNLSFGPQTVKDLSKAKEELFFDTHLMLDNPHKYIEAFTDAGSDLISIHVEPDYDVAATLKDIKSRGIQNGIVLNPGTAAEAALPFIGDVDLILIMSVWPGFGGQSFIRETLDKMEQLNKWRQEKGLSFRIEVDGGVNRETALECLAHGADTLVAGTAFFKDESPEGFRRHIEG